PARRRRQQRDHRSDRDRPGAGQAPDPRQEPGATAATYWILGSHPSTYWLFQVEMAVIAPFASIDDSFRVSSTNSYFRRRSGDSTSLGSTLPVSAISLSSLFGTSMTARPLNDTMFTSRAATGASGSVVCASI